MSDETPKVSTLSSIAKRLIDPKTKVLFKASFIDKDLSITKVGRNRLLAILFEANIEELVKTAKEEIAEAKEDKGC